MAEKKEVAQKQEFTTNLSEWTNLVTGLVSRDFELCGVQYDEYSKSNMTWPNDSSLDIMKVFKPELRKFSIMLSDEHNCIWKREEVRRMTVSEVCKELGYEVEIVRDDS